MKKSHVNLLSVWIHSSALSAYLQPGCHKSQWICIRWSCGDRSQFRCYKYDATDTRNHRENSSARFLGFEYFKCSEPQILSPIDHAHVQFGVSHLPPRSHRRLHEMDEFVAALCSLLLAIDNATEIIARSRREGGVDGNITVYCTPGAHWSRLWHCRSGRCRVRTILHALHKFPCGIIET